VKNEVCISRRVLARHFDLWVLWGHVAVLAVVAIATIGCPDRSMSIGCDIPPLQKRPQENLSPESFCHAVFETEANALATCSGMDESGWRSWLGSGASEDEICERAGEAVQRGFVSFDDLDARNCIA
jgi:hypothetical protein